MIEGLQLSIPKRMILLRIVLVLSVIISVLLSFNLWGGARHFPPAPVFANNLVEAPFDYVFIIFALLFWISALFLKFQRLLLFLSFLLSVALVLFDINRLQPWFYVYNAMLLVLLFYNGRVDDSNKFISLFILLQIISASVYFFCGLSQLNSSFIEKSFAEIISPLQNIMSERQFLFMKKLGIGSPFLLVFTGLGLMISSVRYLAITTGVLTHVLLLIFLFPSENNQNYALWFSNLASIFILFLLFSGKTKQRYFSPTFLFRQPLFYLIIPLFVIMPFFNVNNYYPDFLSFNFKSGNNNSASIKVQKSLYEKLPSYEREYCIPKGDTMEFDYKKMCLDELKTDCVSSEKVFIAICNYLESYDGSNVKETELTLLPKQKLLCKP